jgi:glycosyltransferase involved in cell wall biosynthesis
MKLSLILATRGRTAELHRLFRSLLGQSYKNFVTIVVDQNEDDRVAPVLAQYADQLEFFHIRSETRGHAAANNVGLRVADGDIIGIPDDDCWYAPDLFERLVKTFEQHREWDGLTGREAVSPEAPIGHRFDLEAGQVTAANVWRRHISFTMFFRREKLNSLLYDEALGVGAGTVWGSGEETDFLLRFVEAGNYVQYDPAFVVFHPDWAGGPMTPQVFRKAYSYGVGMGRVLQTHPFPVRIVVKYLFRPFAGTLVALATGRFPKARYHWSIAIGRLSGWLLSLRLQLGAARS